MSNNIQIDIEQEIKDYQTDQKWAKECPEFGQYLKLNEQLKLLDNQKSNCENILQINEIINMIESVETKIYEILQAEWTPIY
jgi:hypothetical protein